MKMHYICIIMIRINTKIIISVCLLLFAFCGRVDGLYAGTASSDKPFILVIDAGHGGKDPGALGRSAKEKDINLSVAKAFGKLVEENHSDVKVIYTRKSDIFVTLGRRAEIANKASADLFVSIHTNALPKKKIGRGAETYTLGMARADDNLEVAKRENAVILVENDYQERYQGFDPNSSESYIIFEFMQDKNMENSVNFAKNIQKEFKSTGGRIDKGVHQAGFLVLRETSMPSVLVELGYISTPDEERFLSSKNGINKMSRSLYNAFCQYRKGHSKTTITITENTIPQPPQPLKETVKAETKKDNPSPVFKVQLMASSQQLKSNNPRFKGLKPIDFYKEKGLYKYTYGATNNYQEAVKLKNTAKKYFKEAFIIAFKNGVKTDVQKAINETKKNKK